MNYAKKVKAGNDLKLPAFDYIERLSSLKVIDYNGFMICYR